MKKIYLINFSLMARLADKKRGTVEDATSFITCTEIFFASLAILFIVISLLPFKVSPYVLGAIGVVIWYYTNYVMRKNLRVKIAKLKVQQEYKTLDRRTARKYLVSSVILFFINFYLFFAVTVWTLEGYYT